MASGSPYLDVNPTVTRRGALLGVLTHGLLQLLDSHGAQALEAAIGSALAKDAVRHFIDAYAHARRRMSLFRTVYYFRLRPFGLFTSKGAKLRLLPQLPLV